MPTEHYHLFLLVAGEPYDTNSEYSETRISMDGRWTGGVIVSRNLLEIMFIDSLSRFCGPIVDGTSLCALFLCLVWFFPLVAYGRMAMAYGQTKKMCTNIVIERDFMGMTAHARIVNYEKHRRMFLFFFLLPSEGRCRSQSW